MIVKFTPIRVVCQNTLLLAIDSGEKGHRVRHCSNGPTEIHQDASEPSSARRRICKARSPNMTRLLSLSASVARKFASASL